MKIAFAVILTVLSCALCHEAIGMISSDSFYYQNITVANGTAASVTFVPYEQHCVHDRPDSITVPPNQSVVFVVTLKAHDSDGDTCYSDDHKIGYADQADSKTVFNVQTILSNDNYCLDYLFFAFFYINRAICPRVRGNMITAQNDNSSGASFGQVYCPPGVPACPPHDDGDKTEYFGFLYSLSSVGGAPPSSGPGLSIPAVEPWGLLILFLALAALGASRIRKRG